MVLPMSNAGRMNANIPFALSLPKGSHRAPVLREV